VPKPAHQIPVKQWTKEIMATFPESLDGPTGDILFFVHGYNNSVAEVDQRHRLVQSGLTANAFPCLVVSFDWPSGSEPLAYLADRDKARLTALRMVNGGIRLFVQAQDLVCDVNVHVLGHSTGAFAIREAFDHADDGQSTATSWTAGQLVLIAGDVSAKSFLTDDPETESTFRHCYRLTNYSNGYDEVLQVSNVKRVGLAPRVGRVGLPGDAPQKAINVDCSDYFHRTYGASDLTPAFAVKSHSWHFEDATFHKDLAVTLRGAIDHQLISTRQSGGGRTQALA
jgi:esterase/lipase superfamily enzyme